MNKFTRDFIFVVLGLIFLVAVAYFLLVGKDMIAITSTTNQFMTAASHKDSETAYALLAHRIQIRMSLDAFKKFLNEDELNYKEYENLCVQSIEFEPAFLYQGAPKTRLGRIAKMEACLYYKDPSKKGSATVFLENENGTWRILNNQIAAYYTNIDHRTLLIK